MQATEVLGQLSWRVATDEVEVFVTQTGGHLGPVTFHRHTRPVKPFSVAPWAEESHPDLPPMLQVLRGDFFCLPFGGNDTPFESEAHPPHGEAANAPWTLESLHEDDAGSALRLNLQTGVRAGRVVKTIRLRAGHNVVYSRHVVSGMSGPMNPGHHAMLRFPDAPESGLISTSPFLFGQVCPTLFEQPENGGRQSLQPAAQFNTLDSVPLLNGGTADLSRYPARRGYEDLVMLVGDDSQPFGWTAVSFPGEGYVWFTLKDLRVLRSTIFWISNGGRRYAPWNGRHINVMGLEEVTSYFHFGLSQSAAMNPIAERGIPTCLQLDAAQPLVVNTIMAVALIPPEFDRVASIEPSGHDAVTVASGSGAEVRVPLDHNFLWTGVNE